MFVMSMAALAAPDVAVDLHGLLQARVGMNSLEGAKASGYSRMARARALVDTHVGDELRGVLQVEMVGGLTLLDARVDATVSPWLTISAGQQIVPYSRSWNTPLPVVALGDRSLPNNLFSPGRRLGVNARVHQGPLTAWVGLYDATAPGELLGDVHAPMGVARVELATAEARPSTELPSLDTVEPAIAVGGGVGVEQSAGEAVLRGTIDAAVHAGGFSAQVEGFTLATLGDLAHVGGSVQLGQFVVPHRLAVHGRVSAVDAGTTDDQVHLVPELGFTGYIQDAHALVQVRARLGGPTASLRTGEAVLRGQLMF